MLTPSGRPYPPGTITRKIYVLKDTDEWLADESETGEIWSGGLGKVKSNQHTRRFILDHDGTVLRPPIAAGAEPVPAAGISPDAVQAARAVGRLPTDNRLRQHLLRSLIRQITPDKPPHDARGAESGTNGRRARGPDPHRRRTGAGTRSHRPVPAKPRVVSRGDAC
jgi:hypothetical protein